MSFLEIRIQRAQLKGRRVPPSGVLSDPRPEVANNENAPVIVVTDIDSTVRTPEISNGVDLVVCGSPDQLSVPAVPGPKQRRSLVKMAEDNMAFRAVISQVSICDAS